MSVFLGNDVKIMLLTIHFPTNNRYWIYSKELWGNMEYDPGEMKKQPQDYSLSEQRQWKIKFLSTVKFT